MTSLPQWWIDTSRADLAALMPKVVEYGATDLEWVGRQMLASQGRTEGVSTEEATEVGIYWFVLGKVARWAAAVQEGRRPSDDTLLDIGIYATMARRNRAAGCWPGPLAPGYGSEGEEGPPETTEPGDGHSVPIPTVVVSEAPPWAGAYSRRGGAQR